MDTKSIWNKFLDEIKQNTNSMVFETWFMDTELIDLNGSTAKVLVPMHVHKKFLKENYSDLIESVFTDITGSNFSFEYLTEEEVEKNIEIDTDSIGVPSFNFESNLKNQYQFENFIVGQSNKYARTTALAVSEKPGLMYNPLFIYGNSGLGKTHLMHAIGNYIVRNTKKKVLYVTSDQFVNDFIELS